MQGLLDLGILRRPDEGCTVADLMRERISVAFFPHGLGHHLGMDTHDTGGNPDYGDRDSLFRFLRIRGSVPEGAVVTVEPGVYFCRFILEPFLRDEVKGRFIDERVLEGFWGVGGVRIEGSFLLLLFLPSLSCFSFTTGQVRFWGCYDEVWRRMLADIVGVLDDVLVTKDGYENLTTAPKGIEEMERIIAGGSLDGEDRG